MGSGDISQTANLCSLVKLLVQLAPLPSLNLSVNLDLTFLTIPTQPSRPMRISDLKASNGVRSSDFTPKITLKDIKTGVGLGSRDNQAMYLVSSYHLHTGVHLHVPTVAPLCVPALDQPPASEEVKK